MHSRAGRVAPAVHHLGRALPESVGPAVLAAQMSASKHRHRERKSLGLATESTATIEHQR